MSIDIPINKRSLSIGAAVILLALLILTYFSGVKTAPHWAKAPAPAAAPLPPVVKWTTSEYGYPVLWCGVGGQYVGHVEKSEGGWYDVMVSDKNKGSFAEEKDAEAYLTTLAKDTCQ
jgi:hypothetical protein